MHTYIATWEWEHFFCHSSGGFWTFFTVPQPLWCSFCQTIAGSHWVGPSWKNLGDEFSGMIGEEFVTCKVLPNRSHVNFSHWSSKWEIYKYNLTRRTLERDCKQSLQVRLPCTLRTMRYTGKGTLKWMLEATALKWMLEVTNLWILFIISHSCQKERPTS